MSVQAKFTCTSIKKYSSTVWDTEGKNHKQGFAYAYEFQAVTGTSEENKSFFASTPTGNLSMSAVRDDLFEPGKSYYLDFTLAE
jgi:hypothetical protein